MESGDIWRLVAAFVLVLANGFFVASEFAIVKVRQTRLQELSEAGSSRAKAALRVVKRLDAYLSANQLGITLASLALGWIGEPALSHLIEKPLSAIQFPWTVATSHIIATVIAFAIITFFHTVVGELAPKSLAINKAEQTALWTSAPLHWFFMLSYPLIVTLNGSANLLLRVVGLPPATGHGDAHSEEELRLIFEASARGGTLSESTRDLLTNIVDYTERVAREVMTPRARVDVLDARRTWDENIKTAISGEWTRYPVVEGERGKIVGFVHIKDLFKAHADPNNSKRDLRAYVRQPLIVPETMPLDRLRRRIQSTRTQLSLVVDEFGTLVGIVTLEDCLEEIVGEIQDETDQESPQIVRDDAGAAEVDGALLLDEVEDEIGLEIPQDERDGVDTVGGFVFSRLARPPVLGDVVEFGRHRLVVTGVDGLRVARLRITELPPAPGGENGESSTAT